MGGSAPRGPSSPTGLDHTQVNMPEGKRKRWETPSWAVSLSDGRGTWWHDGMDFSFITVKGSDVIAFYRDNWQRWSSLFPAAAASRAAGYNPSVVVCHLKGEAAQLHQPTSEGDLLNFSFLGPWCWRRGEQSLTAPRTQMPLALREDHCVTWRDVSFHPITPAHVGMEKREPGGRCHVRPFVFRPAWITCMHLCVHKYSPYLQFKKCLLLLVHAGMREEPALPTLRTQPVRRM